MKPGKKRKAAERRREEGEGARESGLRSRAALRLAVTRRDRSRCLRCGRRDQLTVDHIVPRARGGTSTLDNLQTLCRQCNGTKGECVTDYRARPRDFRGVFDPTRWIPTAPGDGAEE